ncbi:transposase [Flavilitoribacter nigricans]|uniref:Transposase IS200-like domain-containing protein n=1 Tax=Flavilitoribacter nigricans (strain ATCC 23147 / DSM 23189 / NBRC 102662 / NCIMB 1420 / SS-2) TaxID=1122177 RepID=A0A2D0N922_FLAN2|nr:transposase [Flavilitoribacter nigricans]PHN04876.1 hypothetical protein CRP01_20430 [Flavilitoribacter nigricans DSM 23189 = NBRC 102662]
MAFNYWQQLEEGEVYHLYNRSVNKEKLFIDDKDYAFFLQKTQKYLLPYCDFYAYCLMPNHFHFLIEVLRMEESTKAVISRENTKASEKLLANEISVNSFLEDQCRRLFSSYALYFNRRYKRTGALFQSRFKRVSVNNDVKQLSLICYIHHNPIHHRITNDYQNWRYSSYHTFFSKKSSNINRNKVLEWFGSGNSVLGKELFIRHHQDFKQLPTESWTLD